MYIAKSKYRGEVAGHYVERRSGSRKWRREHDILTSILDRLPKGMSVLDVPIGTGRFLGEYSARQHDVIGVDVSSDMLAEAENASRGLDNHNALLLGDAEALQFRDASVDCVVCFRFLNLVPFTVFGNVLDEISRVTRTWIVLEIRVSEQPRLLSAVKHFANPKTAFRVVRTEAGLLRTAWRKHRHQTTSEMASGRIIHRSEDVTTLFAKYNLAIDDVVMVDEEQRWLGAIRMPLKVFLLRKAY